MSVELTIRELANKYATALNEKINQRVEAMKEDDKSHYLIYRVLGVNTGEGDAIDIYQNKGRFLYRYAGTFLEAATKVCFESKYPNAKSLRIPNTQGQRPKRFEIDCLIENEAYEIKWRDATTDGDHITKEHTRVRVVAEAGYRPIRLMYYYPNRKQAQRIQLAIEDLYKANGGAYYYADTAWQHVQEKTDIDLLSILETIADENSV